VHDHTPLGPVFAAIRGDGPPLVHTIHSRWTPGARRTLGAIADRVHLVAISEAQQRANLTVPYAGVVHNGVELDAHPFRAQKEDFLIFIGRVSPEKGPHVAVDVARRAGMPLVMIVKRDEPEEWEFWEQAVRPRLSADVQVLEQPPHMVKAELLSRARAALCPIDWPEPFGLVFVEAAACGTPVITRPLGAAPEIVRQEVTGFLCVDADEMVDAVAAAPDIDPEVCRAHVAESFSADAMVRKYERMYRQVCESPSPRRDRLPHRVHDVEPPRAADRHQPALDRDRHRLVADLDVLDQQTAQPRWQRGRQPDLTVSHRRIEPEQGVQPQEW
jgi:glycosyltransferase involved in cell wall biosynthesis